MTVVDQPWNPGQITPAGRRILGLDGNPSELEQLVTAGLLAALGGSVAALAYAARSDGPGGFDVATEWTTRIRRPLDARREARRPPETVSAPDR